MSSDSSSDDDDKEAEPPARRTLAPPPLVFSDPNDECTTLHFHPTDTTLAVGHMDGRITLHEVDASSGDGAASNESCVTIPAHKQPCRCVRFMPPDTHLLASVSRDKSLTTCDVQEGKVVRRIRDAHGSAIYALYTIDDHLIATGDDDGHVKLWDMRRQSDDKPVVSWHDNEDYVSDMTMDDDRRVLVTTSGEGTLTAYDVRSRKLVLQSELFDAEFLSAETVKAGNKVVCGGSDGVLHVFNRGQWGNISDRYPLTPATGAADSIDCLQTITPDTLCAGCSDGTIKLVHVLPNYVMCADLAEGECGGEPVMALTLSPHSPSLTPPLLASTTFTNTVRFHCCHPPDQHQRHRRKTKAPPKVKKKKGGGASTGGGGGSSSKRSADFFSGLAQ